jgi:alpha-1,2-mannosyltransferase
VAATYLPYLVASGAEVLGYLPGYFTEEGYGSGSRSALLSIVLPGPWSTVGAAILVALVAAVVVWRADPAEPWAAQAAMIGATLLILTPAYPWYALLLVPFAAIARRPEWLLLTVALSVRQLHPDLLTSRIAFGAALVLLLLAAAIRHRRTLASAIGRLRTPPRLERTLR